MKAHERSIGWVAALLALVLLAGGGLLATRMMIARAALLGWLRSHGVQAEAQFHSLGLRDLDMSLRLGDPRRPDLVAPRAYVDFRLAGGGVEVRAVRLVQPTLAARLHDGKLSLGQLDPLVKLSRQAPARPNAPKPDITIERGVVLLTTDAGPLRLSGDAEIRDGVLTHVVARTAPTRLTGPGFDVRLGAGSVELRAAGQGVTLTADAPASSLAVGAVSAEDLRLRLTAQTLYPDLAGSQLAGPATANLAASFARLTQGAQVMRAGLLTADLQGRLSGRLQAPALSGTLQAGLRAGAAEAAERVSLAGISITARGPVTAAGWQVGYDLLLRGGAQGRMIAMPAARRGDPPQLAALKQAAQDFTLDAEGVRVRGQGGAVQIALEAPARLLAANGGRALLTPRGQGFRLAVAGGGLPKLNATIDRITLGHGAAAAQVRLQAALSSKPVRDASLDASGRLAIAAGTASFRADRCLRLGANQLDLGARALSGLTGELCPTGRPLLTAADGEVRIEGQARNLAGFSATDQLEARDLGGALQVAFRAGRLAASLRGGRGQLIDRAAPPRVAPLEVAADAHLAGGFAEADFALHDRAGRALGGGKLTYDLARQRGEAQVDTGMLAFAPGGLQPTDLSRLAGLAGSPAEGRLRFAGTFVLTPKAVSGAGRLTVPQLDFQSPLGRVTGLSGEVALKSLTPLASAPGQVLRAARIDTPLGPVGEASASFRTDGNSLRVQQAEGTAFGGRVRLSPLEAELVPGGAMRGVLVLDHVQLSELIEGSPLAGRIRLQAKVDGRLPFEVTGGNLRFASGWLRAVEPGRLSIARGALTAMSGTGGTAVVPEQPKVQSPAQSPALSGFAYQALEDLAFSKLEADVRSEAGGRLRVVFHVIGRHDPPQRQEIRVPMRDFLNRTFLNRNLPLPSGTGVDLTLDTSINLDDLIARYRELTGEPASATVQQWTGTDGRAKRVGDEEEPLHGR